MIHSNDQYGATHQSSSLNAFVGTESQQAAMLLRKKIFSLSTLTLLVALSLSAIAAWYSILGLTAIFAAAVVPIIIMGSALEVAKVVTTVWLHRYWDRATIIMRLYLKQEF